MTAALIFNVTSSEAKTSTTYYYNIKTHKMRNKLIHIFLIAFVLGSCEQIENPGINDKVESNDFCVYLSDIATKTANDGMSTRWVEGDAINLFHAITGANDYINDNSFICDNVAANKFSGTLAEELNVDSSYDWYAFYPSINTSNGDTPVKFSKYIGRTSMSSFAGKVTQTGNNSMAHLAGGRDGFPVVGFVNNVPASEFPTIPMKNVASVICVNVTNTLSEPIAISSIDLVTPKPIIGNFTIELTGNDIVASGAGQEFIRLEVAEGSQIAGGESAKFYIGVAPFTVTSGEEILLYVNAAIGDKTVSQKIAKIFDKETPFKSGFIKTFNVSYAQTDVVPVKVNKSDFQTLNLGVTSTAFKAGSEHYSFDGWKLLTGAVVGPTTFTDGSLKDLAAVICGGTAQTGILTSPFIADGCGTLKFKYGVYNNNEKIRFRIDIKNAAGEVVQTETVENLEPTKSTATEYSKEFNVSGVFQLEFTNLCPSGVKNRKDRVAIFDIEWTSVQ